MRLLIAAVGRLKEGPERALLERYRERFGVVAKRIGFNPVVWHEIAESRAGTAAERWADEGARLEKLAGDAKPMVALGERGKALTSQAFADYLRQVRASGGPTMAILIGGPDGLSPALRQGADLELAFGAITLPHGLARIVLAEQLYRAATILTGHPYHRG